MSSNVTTYATCKVCKKSYNVAEGCCPIEPPKTSTLFKNVSFSFFDSYETPHITGSNVKINSSKDQDRLCEEHGVARAEDYKSVTDNPNQGKVEDVYRMTKHKPAKAKIKEGIDVKFKEG